MFGTLIIGSIGIWLALSAWVAWSAARRVKPIWLKALVIVTLGPLLFVAPVGDELIGKYQFERYCKEADEVKIYGTIPVGLELYTADGKWKETEMSLAIEERNRARVAKNSMIHWELDSLGKEAPAAIPIRYRDTGIFEIKTGRLLAKYRSYNTRGGLLSRVLFERAGILVKPQCFPEVLQGTRISRGTQVEETILPFDRNGGGIK